MPDQEDLAPGIEYRLSKILDDVVVEAMLDVIDMFKSQGYAVEQTEDDLIRLGDGRIIDVEYKVVIKDPPEDNA